VTQRGQNSSAPAGRVAGKQNGGGGRGPGAGVPVVESWRSAGSPLLDEVDEWGLGPNPRL
jgi:hypothetical protein